MKVLVTGAEGMLGSDLCRIFSDRQLDVIAAPRSRLDVRISKSVDECLSDEKPGLVVHAAAITDADECERDPDAAFLTNTIGAWNVTLASARIDAVLVYVSSCGIFDGSKRAPYSEFDRPNPLTKHHQSKYEAERIVSSLCRRYYIVRPGWLFGGTRHHRKNFVDQRRREALGKPAINSANDKFGSPTYTVDLANQMLRLIESGAFGVYHVVNASVASRYEYVSKIVDYLGLSTEVTPVSSNAFPREAPVPDWEALENYSMRLRGFEPMRPWEEALKDYIENRLLPELASGEEGADAR